MPTHQPLEGEGEGGHSWAVLIGLKKEVGELKAVAAVSAVGVKSCRRRRGLCNSAPKLPVLLPKASMIKGHQLHAHFRIASSSRSPLNRGGLLVKTHSLHFLLQPSDPMHRI